MAQAELILSQFGVPFSYGLYLLDCGDTVSAQVETGIDGHNLVTAANDSISPGLNKIKVILCLAANRAWRTVKPDLDLLFHNSLLFSGGRGSLGGRLGEAWDRGSSTFAGGSGGGAW